MIRSFDHTDFPLRALLAAKREPITVVLPARETAETVGEIVERLVALEGLVDQVLVVDAASRDGTAAIAERAGAEVVQERELVPELGEVRGKGDAMWRSLAAVRGELVAFLDADTRDFSAHFACGLLGPLLAEPAVSFVKGAFRRPFTSADGHVEPGGGGRVTELCARPLLSAFHPELAGLAQPLAGEVAARRSLLEAIPFATGYAVETAMLLAVRDVAGIDAMAEVHLGERRNRHQPLTELGPMAYAVLSVIVAGLRADGRLEDGLLPPFQAADGRLVESELLERPPFGTRGAAPVESPSA